MLSEKRQAGIEVLDLTESNPTRAGLSYQPEIVACLADPAALRYDPRPEGLLSARQAVCRYYAGLDCVVEPERLLLTASTSEAYQYLFKLLADPGDEVLVPRPSYPLFEFLANMESLRVVSYPLVYHGGWTIDCEALAAAITPRSRAIVVVNPNNPTGSFLKRDELRFLEACGVPLISDEVFADYAFTGDSDRVRTLASGTGTLSFAMSGLSKIAGLPQMKLGWIVVSGPEAARTEAREKLEWIADTYLSVSTPVQLAAPRLLELRQGHSGANRGSGTVELVVARSTIASNSPCRILAVEGGWYATVQVPRIRREEEWVLELLDRDNVLVQPGFFFDFESEAFLVVSLLTAQDIFRKGCLRLLARVEDGSAPAHG